MGKVVYRVGTGELPRLRGARRECDPGSIPHDRFRDIVNGRLVGLELRSRGGQEKVLASALEGCLTGIFPAEYQDADTVSLLVLSGRTGGVGSTETMHVWDGTTLTPLSVTMLGRVKDLYVSPDGDLYCSTGAVDSDAGPVELRALRIGVQGDLAEEVLAAVAPAGGLMDDTLGGIAVFEGIPYTVHSSWDGVDTRTNRILRAEDGAFVEDFIEPSTDSGAPPESHYAVGLSPDGSVLWAVTRHNRIRAKYTTAGDWEDGATLGEGGVISRSFARSWVVVAENVHIGIGEVGSQAVTIEGFNNQDINIGSSLIAPADSLAPAPLPMAHFLGAVFYGWKGDDNVVHVGRYGYGDESPATVDDYHTFTGTEPITALVTFKNRLYALRGDTLESTGDGTTWQVDETVVDAFVLGVATGVD